MKASEEVVIGAAALVAGLLLTGLFGAILKRLDGRRFPGAQRNDRTHGKRPTVPVDLIESGREHDADV